MERDFKKFSTEEKFTKLMPPISGDKKREYKKVIRRLLSEHNTSVYDYDVVSNLWFIDARLVERLKAIGIISLLPAQTSFFSMFAPVVTDSSDLVFISSPGGGKTVAYGVCILNKLSLERPNATNRPRALVVLPTRDLALQVKDTFDQLASAVDLTVGHLWAESTYKRDLDIIVTTPQDLLHHMERTRCFTLKYLEYLVIDEADRLLKEEQEPWLANILEAHISSSDNDDKSKGEKLIKIVVSNNAILDVSKLDQLWLRAPVLISSCEVSRLFHMAKKKCTS